MGGIEYTASSESYIPFPDPDGDVTIPSQVDDFIQMEKPSIFHQRTRIEGVFSLSLTPILIYSVANA